MHLTPILEIEFEEAEAEAEAEVAPIPPHVPANPEPETVTIGTGRLTPLKRLFTDTQVWTGSSSSSVVVGHNPKDPTPSHIRSDLDALHRRVRQIESDDMRAENKQLRMMLDCSENCTRDAWRELDRTTWHYHHVRRWSITVENLLPPRLQYQEPPYAQPEALLAPVTHNDPRDPYIAAHGCSPLAPCYDNEFYLLMRRLHHLSHKDLHLVTLSSLVSLVVSFILIMAPKAMSQAAIERLITERVNAAVEAEQKGSFTTIGLEAANQIGWTEMRRLMTEEFCPIEEIQNNSRDNTRHNQQNNQRQGNARAMTPPAEKGDPTVMCYDCGEKGHTRNYYPKRRDPQGEEAQGRAYVIREIEKQQGPNVVTGTFLLNSRYATVLFDLGSDKSFVNTSFSHLIDINPVRLDTSYEVELADGRVASTKTILRGCTLNLLDHLFKIDLMPIELGTFDVVIGMDWLVDQDAVIVCGKKVVHIPVKNKTLVVEGDRVIRDSEVFLWTYLDPTTSHVGFKIELVPGAAPVARAPYRLAPSEMKEWCIVQELSAIGVHVDPAKVEAIRNWSAPTTPKEVRQFLGLAGYYRRFIEGFSLISKPLTKLTEKNKKYEWGTEEDEAFQTLKQKLCSAPILALPEGTENFVVYCDGS
ncbi:putative reverse transcriptase domain-containing protein [Tanacetum coccineum]